METRNSSRPCTPPLPPFQPTPPKMPAYVVSPLYSSTPDNYDASKLQVGYTTALSDYILERVCTNFFVSVDGKLKNNSDLMITSGDVFYFPGNFSRQNLALRFDLVYVTPEQTYTIPVDLCVTEGNKARFHFVCDYPSITLPSGSYTFTNVQISYFLNYECYEVLSYRLMNFKESCYYLRKSTEDALLCVLASKGFYPIEFDEYWMNFSIDERVYMDKAYKAFFYDKNNMGDMRKTLLQLLKLIENALEVERKFPNSPEAKNALPFLAEDLFAPLAYTDYKEGKITLRELEKICTTIKQIFENYFNCRIFHVVGQSQYGLWTKWNVRPNPGVECDHTLLHMKDVFKFDNTYLDVTQVVCNQEEGKRLSPWKIQILYDTVPYITGKIARIPCKRLYDMKRVLYSIPFVIKPNGVDTPKGFMCLVRELNALPRFCSYTMTISQEYMPKKLATGLYSKCRDRPYGSDWMAYLYGGRFGYGFVNFHETTCPLANHLLKEEYAIALTRKAIMNARDKSEYPWVRNIAHCPANRNELVHNRWLFKELKYM